jgi:hypothetical protein
VQKAVEAEDEEEESKQDPGNEDEYFHDGGCLMTGGLAKGGKMARGSLAVLAFGTIQIGEDNQPGENEDDGDQGFAGAIRS